MFHFSWKNSRVSHGFRQLVRRLEQSHLSNVDIIHIVFKISTFLFSPYTVILPDAPGLSAYYRKRAEDLVFDPFE